VLPAAVADDALTEPDDALGPPPVSLPADTKPPPPLVVSILDSFAHPASRAPMTITALWPNAITVPRCLLVMGPFAMRASLKPFAARLAKPLRARLRSAPARLVVLVQGRRPPIDWR